MAKNSPLWRWQEQGVRLGGQVLTEAEAADIVAEMRRWVRDPEAVKEVEEFLCGKREEFSPHVRDVLQMAVCAVVMKRPKT